VAHERWRLFASCRRALISLIRLTHAAHQESSSRGWGRRLVLEGDVQAAIAEPVVGPGGVKGTPPEASDHWGATQHLTARWTLSPAASGQDVPGHECDHDDRCRDCDHGNRRCSDDHTAILPRSSGLETRPSARRFALAQAPGWAAGPSSGQAEAECEPSSDPNAHWRPVRARLDSA
jgi:hypothetical protein